jgi:two-component system sensor histidine kinase PilS (NtrC family)
VSIPADALPAAEMSAGLIPKLKWLVGLRLLLASALLGSAGALDWRGGLPFGTAALYGLMAVTFALSLAYALALRSPRHLRTQTFGQLLCDLLLVSALVHYTGGVDSVLPFMYIFVVFAAANTLERKGSLSFAVASAALYGGLILAEWTRLLQPVEFAGGLAPLRSAGYAVYQVLTHTVAFVAVAILSSHLADRLRQAGQELERRGLDLRNLQTLHQAIVTNIASGLVTLDLAGRIVSFNRAAEQITGYPFAEIRDRHWQSTVFAVCPVFAEFFAAPAAPPASSLTELTLERRDGRAIPVGISCSALPGADGQPAGLVAIFQDLTDRQRVEEQLRRADRLAALGQLAASIAHEIRNPLAAISGSVEMLCQDLSPGGANRELMDIVLRETHRLKLITGQFLEFSKPVPLLRRPCAVKPHLLETLQILERSSERHPALRWHLREEAPSLAVLADPDQVRQVFWNLCLNALQAMPDGGDLTVTLRSAPAGEGQPVTASADRQGGSETVGRADHSADRPSDPSTEGVEIEFHDTGRGIPREDLDRIFDPFFTTRQSGTGLGLSIARKLLESMGGRITVESPPGRGTTFRLWLLRAPAAQAAAGKE